MILAHGKIFEKDKENRILSALSDETNETLLNKTIDREKLISTIDIISKKLKDGEYNGILSGIDTDGLDGYVSQAAEMLSAEGLKKNLSAQIPEPAQNDMISAKYYPAGVLLHIAAGNVDVLPAYSVLTGLLCGNVNILKLPSQDDGLTVKILYELIRLMPELADFIYVFDTPSSDVASICEMAKAADVIVVWGGDEAVSAVRRLAPPYTRVVCWGHKIGFAYIGADYEKRPGELAELAEHIIKTSQFLCSSCQRIYVDSADPADADRFCRYFLPVLQAARDKRPLKDTGAAAENTIFRYSRRIERSLGVTDGKIYYDGDGCTLAAKDDPTLEISGFFGTVDVTALPLEKLFYVLREKKGYLQTACVIADENTKKRAEEIMVRAGVTRIMKPSDMSKTFSGEAHDGEFELLNYMRIINREK